MALLIFELNKKRGDWDVFGKITNGEIVEDPASELEATMEGAYDSDDKDHLKRASNNYYVNAAPLAENEE